MSIDKGLFLSVCFMLYTWLEYEEGWKLLGRRKAIGASSHEIDRCLCVPCLSVTSGFSVVRHMKKLAAQANAPVPWGIRKPVACYLGKLNN